MRAFKRNTRGFTLVELMIVVAIIGVLAALAIYGVTKYLASAKTSEAKNTIGAISRAAQEAYEREQVAAEIIADGSEGSALSHDLCATSSYSLVTAIPAGKKSQPAATTFNSPVAGSDNNTGWKCLRFSLTDPTYYRYAYVANRVGADPPGETVGTASVAAGLPTTPKPGYVAQAEGDLDGNGVFSSFGIQGQVDSIQNTVKVSTQPIIVNELE